MFEKIAGTAGLALALAAGSAALAQSPAPAMMHGMSGDVSSMDCSTAAAHMAALMHPSDTGAMKAPADADHAFAADATAMMQHEMMLAKMEVKCGKNPKAVEAAKKMESQLQKMVFGTLF